MKNYILALLLFLPFSVQATDPPAEPLNLTLDPYLSSYKEASGVRFSFTGGNHWRWRGEVNYSDRLPGLGGGGGYWWHDDVALFFTVNKTRNGSIPDAPINYVPEQPAPPLNQNITMTDGQGYSYNLELDYKWVFVRYTYYDLEHDYSVSHWRQGPNGPVYVDVDQGIVSTSDDMISIGLRIPLL